MDLPSALERFKELAASRRGRPAAVGLDFDGTLAPLVAQPGQARLPDQTRAAVAALAKKCPVFLVSGRDLADLKAKANLAGLLYVGSHGNDIEGPGLRHAAVPEAAKEIEAAARELEPVVAALPGALLEPKRYAVALHFRNAAPEAEARLAEAVERVLRDKPDLMRTHGKKVMELRPKAGWHKGQAVRWLLGQLGLESPWPVFVGDDLTDEDALKEVREDGCGVLVAAEPRPTAARWRLQDPDEVRTFVEKLAVSV